MIARLLSAGVLGLALAGAGCSSSAATEPEVYISTPLAFDPTEEHELATWWSNGRRLLYFGDDGFYAIFDEGNRYRRADERGKWWKHSYAVLWLEPYDTPEHETRRVAINKTDGALELTIGRLDPFAPLAGPPEVLEDRLIGHWNGEPGRLELRADMRYVFTPRAVSTHEPASLSRHVGRWQLEGETLVLHADSPRTAPMALGLLDRGASLVLAVEGGELRRGS